MTETADAWFAWIQARRLARAQLTGVSPKPLYHRPRCGADYQASCSKWNDPDKLDGECGSTSPTKLDEGLVTGAFLSAAYRVHRGERRRRAPDLEKVKKDAFGRITVEHIRQYALPGLPALFEPTKAKSELDSLMRLRPHDVNEQNHDNLGRKRAVLPGGHEDLDRRDSNDQRWREVNDVAVDFLRAGGWRIEKAGSTGNPSGRPVKGATSLEFIQQRLETLLARPLHDVLAGAALGGKAGAKPGPQRSAYNELALVICQLVDARIRPVNRAALADVLDCTPSALTRLVRRGRIESNQKSPKSERESTLMIVTDDQLALDAERLAEVADRLERERREIVAIATRLRRRFPADRVLAQAVEEFIGAALGEEQAA